MIKRDSSGPLGRRWRYSRCCSSSRLALLIGLAAKSSLLLFELLSSNSRLRDTQYRIFRRIPNNVLYSIALLSRGDCSIDNKPNTGRIPSRNLTLQLRLSINRANRLSSSAISHSSEDYRQGSIDREFSSLSMTFRSLRSRDRTPSDNEQQISTESTQTLTFAVQLLTIRVGAQVLGGVDQLVQLRLLLLQLAQDVLQRKITKRISSRK